LQLHPNKSLFLTLKYWRSAGIKNIEVNENQSEEDSQNSEEDMGNLKSCFAECQSCPLSKHRKNIVFGGGSPLAKIMFISNAPDEHDDETGTAFSKGDASLLQKKIFKKMQLKEEQIYFTHTVKCRPQEDRIPENNEVQACNKILQHEIDIIKPKVIVTLGTLASANLLNSEEPISKLRGTIYDYQGIALMPTYHPNYLLKKLNARYDVWRDMQKVLNLIK
jgi:uracil-DNA glycosylase